MTGFRQPPRLTLARAPPTIAAAVTRPRSIELRPSLLSLLPFALAVLARRVRDARPTARRRSQSPPPVPLPTRSPSSPRSARRRRRMPPLTAVADLEPLPPPADDLWDAHPPAVSRCPTSTTRWSRNGSNGTRRGPTTSRAWSIAAGATCIYIVVEVEQRGMPLEIALLPMVESAFNPIAMSTRRASGIWQFMPSTGKHYGLKQNFWFDSRRDVVAATDKRAQLPAEAPRRFRRLAARARRLQLGRRQRRRGPSRRTRSAGCRPTTRACKMPDETRNYLPKLQALKNIVRDPEKYGLALADIPDAPYFAVVKTTARWTSSARPSSPRCRSRNSCTSIRSTTAR